MERTLLIDSCTSHCKRRHNLLTLTGDCTPSRLSRISPLNHTMLVNIPTSLINGSGREAFYTWCRYYRTVLVIVVIILNTLSSVSCSSDPDFLGDQPPGVDHGSHDNNAHGSWTFGNEKQEKLRSFTLDLMSTRCRDVPGLSMALVAGGKSKIKTGFGHADIVSGKAATASTTFCIASLSKAFTATLLARLVERMRNSKGRQTDLSLDTNVWDILPDAYPFRDEYTTRHITIRDLLSHRTGIARHDLVWLSGIKDQEDIFRRLKCMKNEKGFRASPKYNNILYALAGRVAEHIGGDTWENLTRKELLQPLGMIDTTFMREQEHGALRAKQYAHRLGKPMEIEDVFSVGAKAVSPAIGVCSNARDMTTWMQFHLSPGRTQSNHTLITPSMMKEMYKGQVSTDGWLKPLIEKDNQILLSYDLYGLGWFVGYYKGYRTLMHYGSYPGFYSMITLVPSKKFGIFTSVNGGIMEYPYSINNIIHTYAMDLAMAGKSDVDPKMDEGTCHPIVPNYSLKCHPLNSGNLPKRHLEKYVGTYFNGAYGKVEFSLEQNMEEGKDDNDYDNVQHDFIITYNDLTYRALIISDSTPTDFCLEALEKDETNFYRNTAKFSINTLTNVVDHVNVSMFTEDPMFVKVPEGVSFEEWSQAECGASVLPCDKIKTLPSVANSAVSRAGHFILIVCILIFGL